MKRRYLLVSLLASLGLGASLVSGAVYAQAPEPSIDLRAEQEIAQSSAQFNTKSPMQSTGSLTESLAASSIETGPETALMNVQHQWAKVNYQLNDEAQETAFEALLADIQGLTAANPDSADYLIWQGIIQSSYAGAKGGLGALSLAKQAKKSLEKALAINPDALSGSAYTSLGTLYHKVPGWPVAFGSDDKAKTMLEKALAINPTGIDPNYFYGEFLFDERQYAMAKQVLETALAAPKRAQRPVADESRRAEVLALMKKVDAKLGTKG
jgi:tetratricopeptide (TPR) repeat protein